MTVNNLNERKPFTLRLNQFEIDCLDELKEMLYQNTASAAIRHLILNFSKISQELAEVKNENWGLTQELDELKSDVSDFLSAFGNLKNKANA